MKRSQVTRWLITVAIVGTLNAVSAINAQEQAPATSTAPAQEQARWQDVIQQLGSADFTTREAAQKVLDTASWREKDALKQLAAAATDEEVKVRILARVQAIEVQIASDPPPISLDVKDASLDDVAKALTKEMGVPVGLWQDGMRRSGNTYTLSVKDQPFWKIFGELNKQHSLSFQAFNGFRLVEQSTGMQPAEIVGAVAIFPLQITRSQTSDLSKPPGQQLQPEQTTLYYSVAIDPRLAITKYMQPQLTQVVDDLGNALFAPPPRRQGFLGAAANSNFMWQDSIALKIPATHGKMIASAQGEFRFVVTLESKKVEVTDIGTKLNQPLTVAGRSIRVTQWKEHPDESRVEFNFTGDNNTMALPNDPAATRGVLVTFIDSSDGKRLWSTNVENGSGGSTGFQFKGPIKLELSVAIRAKEIVVPFEMKDLPLP